MSRNFRARQHKSDLAVTYRCEMLGCPMSIVKLVFGSFGPLVLTTEFDIADRTAQYLTSKA